MHAVFFSSFATASYIFVIETYSGGIRGVCVCGGGLYRGGNFARKCISTTLMGAPIYIWPRAAIPPAPPLKTYEYLFCFNKKFK